MISNILPSGSSKNKPIFNVSYFLSESAPFSDELSETFIDGKRIHHFIFMLDYFSEGKNNKAILIANYSLVCCSGMKICLNLFRTRDLENAII